MFNKRNISLLFLGIYGIAVFQFMLPYASYYANYTYFATEACIHKDLPQLHCNGTCQLKKMMNKEHKDHSSNKSTQVERTSSSTIFFFNEITPADVPIRATNHFISLHRSSHAQFIGEQSTPPPQLV